MNNPSSSVIKINAINNENWLIMRLIKDQNKTRWNQLGKVITDPTLDFFNKRLNVHFLNKKLGKHFQKSMENLREGKKQYSSKTKCLTI